MTLKELMLQMGSKNGRFDPCAPEWYMRLSASKDPVEQIMGWMQYHTVRFPIRSPYACDQDGNPLTLKHLAADYNWSTRMAQKYWMRATAKHYVKKVEGKLYLRADFKVKGLIVDEDGSSTNVVSIDPTEAYMDSLAPYLREQVAKLPAGRITELATRWTSWDKARKDVEADAMQAARERMKPYETALYGEYKVTVKSLPARQDKRAKAANVHVTMDLFDFAPVPKGAQSSAVLNPNGEEKQPTVPTARHGIESAASPDRRAAEPMGRKVDERPAVAFSAGNPVNRSASPVPTPSVGRNSNGGVGRQSVVAHQTERTPADRPADLATLAAAMLAVEITETLAIKQLFVLCRVEAPDCTPEEVAHWVLRKIAIKQGKRVPNWIGYLHTAVPPCFERAGFEAWRKEQRAFDTTENANTERQRGRARRILDLPPEMRRPNGDWRDADGDLICDDGDREWARRILGETERAMGVA